MNEDPGAALRRSIEELIRELGRHVDPLTRMFERISAALRDAGRHAAELDETLSAPRRPRPRRLWGEREIKRRLARHRR